MSLAASSNFHSTRNTHCTMRLAQSFLPLLALALSGLAGAASSWTFGEASLSLQGKGSGVGGAKKET